MNANIKSTLHGIISIVGNGAIFEMVPAQYKVWALLGFNLIQVVYAFFDQTYAIQQFGKTK